MVDSTSKTGIEPTVNHFEICGTIRSNNNPEEHFHPMPSSSQDATPSYIRVRAKLYSSVRIQTVFKLVLPCFLEGGNNMMFLEGH